MIFSRGLGMLSRMLVCGRIALWCGLLSAVGSAGCTSGTETGNPSIGGELSYTGTSSAPDEVGVREGGRVTVKNAWFELARVTVSSEGDCGLRAGDTFTVKGLGLGDHAAGVHNYTSFVPTPGTYCSVELPFVRLAVDDTAAPAALRGHAIVITGELADGTEFSLQSDQSRVVPLQGAVPGFALGAETNALIAFDFATWLEDLDFASARSVDGRIIVSETSNPELLRAFEAHLARGVALYLDRDADGRLDAEPEVLATGL